MKLTCDYDEGICRAAIWQRGKMTDLYVDSVLSPDLAGAIVRGRVGRVTSGGKAAWCDIGCVDNVYIESKAPLKSGEIKRLRVDASFSGKKAPRAMVLGEDEGPVGVLESPPRPWQRALEYHKGKRIECSFTSQDDYDLCAAQYAAEKHISFVPLVSNIDEMATRIDELKDSHVPLSGGGEIVIEQTESLVAIDINASQARNFLAVNLAAMHEIARQLRLRNLGGIIVIDALKMSVRADKGQVLAALKRACADDPAGATVFDITKLGLIEMTRTRRGRSLMEVL
jgi:Ribonuclease G/E